MYFRAEECRLELFQREKTNDPKSSLLVNNLEFAKGRGHKLIQNYERRNNQLLERVREATRVNDGNPIESTIQFESPQVA